MVETIFGILGFLLLTAFPLGIAFLLFRRTPLGSGDVVLSIRNYTILLAILGGPGILIALGLLFNRRSLIVIGLIIYGVPLAIMTLVSLIGPIFSFFSLVSFVDTRLLARGEDNYWTELEDRLGWTYDQKRKRLSGAFRGRMVTLDEYDSARSWLGWIALVVGYRHFGVGLADQLTRWIRVQITVRNPSNGYMHLTAKPKTGTLDNLFFKESKAGIEIFDQEFHF